MEEAKIGFLNRIKKAVFKLEDYEGFALESTWKSLNYLLKLTLLFAIIVTIAFILILNRDIKIFTNVLRNEIPEFKITGGNLIVEADDNLEEHNYYINGLNMEIVLKESEQETTNYRNRIELLKNKMVVNFMGYTESLAYEDLEISKQDILNFLDNFSRTKAFVMIGGMLFIICFLTFGFIFLVDIFTLAIFGSIINMMIRIPFTLKEFFRISVYAMTLSIILSLLYIIANISVGITVKYFTIAYNLISYIYLIAVLLIIKSDIIKNKQELQRIYEEEKKVKEELARQRQEEKEKQEEANRERKKEKEKEKQEKQPAEEPQTEN